MGAYESGQSFLAGVFAKLPEAVRGQVETAFTSAEAREAVSLIGDGALARSDYSRHMDEIRQKAEELETQHTAAVDLYNGNLAWRQQHETAIGEYNTWKAGQPGGVPVIPAVVVPQPAVDPRAAFAEEMAVRERDYAGFVAFTNELAMRHYQQFGEVLGTSELLADPRLGKPIAGQPGRVFSLQDAYQAKHGERVAGKAKEAEDSRINHLVDEKFAERMKTVASQPFPLRAEASPLDFVNHPEAATLKDDDYLNRAMDTYAALQGSRA